MTLVEADTVGGAMTGTITRCNLAAPCWRGCVHRIA
jgi:hypothetical protein